MTWPPRSSTHVSLLALAGSWRARNNHVLFPFYRYTVTKLWIRLNAACRAIATLDGVSAASFVDPCVWLMALQRGAGVTG